MPSQYFCAFQDNIDGAGNIFGFATTLRKRSSGIPYIAYAKFDSADVNNAIATNQFQYVVNRK